MEAMRITHEEVLSATERIRASRIKDDLPPETCETLRWLAEQPWPGGSAAEHQPPPKPGHEVVADYVLADIQARVEAGEAKYGTKLMTHNGRDPLWDLYQELLDAVFYCRQAILERDSTEDGG